MTNTVTVMRATGVRCCGRAGAAVRCSREGRALLVGSEAVLTTGLGAAAAATERAGSLAGRAISVAIELGAGTKAGLLRAATSITGFVCEAEFISS